MGSERHKLNTLFIITLPVLFLTLVNHYLQFFGYFDRTPPEYLSQINLLVNPNILVIRGVFIVGIALSTFLNAKISQKSTGNWSYLVISLISISIFMNGFVHQNHYNLFIYPLFFVISVYSTVRSVQYVQGRKTDKLQNLFPATSRKKFGFTFATEKGNLHLNKPEYGIAIEAGAGGGKSVIIQNILHQGCNQGYAGVLYDFEGDCRESGGAQLTRTVLSALHQYNQGESPHGRVGFAYLNFADPSRTVRVNPISPKYIESPLDLFEFAKTLMTNLEPEWLKKKDFWAGNAINYCYGILLRLYNDPKLHPYLTIPHLAMIATYNYEAVFKWILQDRTLERRIMPLYVAYKEDAKSQLAGAIASAALPITQLLEPEICYPLSPENEDETFDMDITNEEHPVFFCVGTVPKNKFVLGPVCSLVLLVCMNNMNRFGKRRSLFVIDELPTLFIPNLDNLPATARKKGVCTVLSWQSFKQLEDQYGRDKAEITRDNLSNQLVGKGRNIPSAERIVKYFPKTERVKQNFTTSDSGESISYQTQKEELLQPSDILNQPIGHFTGVLSEGDPPYFHTQFDFFSPQLKKIPSFSKKWFTQDNELDHRLMKMEVLENFKRIEREIDELLIPYEV